MSLVEGLLRLNLDSAHFNLPSNVPSGNYDSDFDDNNSPQNSNFSCTSNVEEVEIPHSHERMILDYFANWIPSKVDHVKIEPEMMQTAILEVASSIGLPDLTSCIRSHGSTQVLVFWEQDHQVQDSAKYRRVLAGNISLTALSEINGGQMPPRLQSRCHRNPILCAQNQCWTRAGCNDKVIGCDGRWFIREDVPLNRLFTILRKHGWHCCMEDYHVLMAEKNEKPSLIWWVPAGNQ